MIMARFALATISLVLLGVSFVLAQNLATFSMHRAPVSQASPMVHAHLSSKMDRFARVLERQPLSLRHSNISSESALTPTADIPLGGNIYPLGIFYLVTGMGDPAQDINVALDTGSCTLLVPGKGCKGCTSQKVYDPSQSSTAKQMPCPSNKYGCFQCRKSQCTFSNTYETCNLTDPTQPCTVTGLMYIDTFELGSMKAPVAVGTIETQTKNFQQFYVIDGVMGFACSTSYGLPIPIEGLAKSGQIADKFSFCLDQSGTGGVFTLGGADPTLSTGAFVYTPFDRSQMDQMYAVNFNDILIGSVSTGIQISDVIVDSGTNILLLDSDSFKTIKNVFQKNFCKLPNVCGSATLFNGHCFNMTQAQIAQFPTLTLVFPAGKAPGDHSDLDPSASIKVPMTPQTYLLDTEGDGTTCLAILDTGDSGLVIIGDTTMQNYVTMFDRDNALLGFAPVNTNTCKYTGPPVPAEEQF